MADWPDTLPGYPDQSLFSETIRDPVVRTDMDAGPQKVRLRYTAVPELYQISMVLTREQRAIFIDFYKNTLNYGVDEFDWYHPVNLDAFGNRIPCACRFTGVYQITPQDNHFNLSISMEVVP